MNKRRFLSFIIFLAVGLSLMLTLAVKNKKIIAIKLFDVTHSPSLSIAADPEDASLMLHIGERYLGNVETYDTDRAEYYFKRAVAIDPHIEGGYYQLTRLAFLRGDFDEALIDINIHIKDHPWYSRNYYMKGLVAGFKKNYPMSIESFQTYVKLDPNYWAGFNDLAWVQLASGDYKGALATVDSVIPRMGNIPWLMNSRGLALMNLSRNEEALVAFKSAKSQFIKWGPSGWGKAYPGNDPAIYSDGFAATLKAVDANIALLESKTTNPK